MTIKNDKYDHGVMFSAILLMMLVLILLELLAILYVRDLNTKVYNVQNKVSDFRFGRKK